MPQSTALPVLATLALIALGACSSTRPVPPPLPKQIGTRTCSDTLHVALSSDGRRWKSGEVRAAVSNSEGSPASLPLPADLVFVREAAVYQQGTEPATVRGSSARVDVRWKGPHTGEWRWHREEVWLECGGRRSVEVELPWEVQIRISTDPEGVSVFSLPGRYGEPQYLGTAPLTTTLLVEPRRYRNWRFLLQKSGMRTDTLVVEAPRQDQVYRVVLQPLPHTVPPRR